MTEPQHHPPDDASLPRGYGTPDHPAIAPEGGPGGYAPYGGSLYSGRGAYRLTPGYADWGARTSGRGDATVPGRGGDAFPGEDTWGEAQYRNERP